MTRNLLLIIVTMALALFPVAACANIAAAGHSRVRFSMWLDRGTIASLKNDGDTARLFDRLQACGIKMVFFEANNGGFAMFRSKLAQISPCVTDSFCPLDSALRAAHARGIELHLWFWVFNVGSERHNKIANKPKGYPGPALAKNGMSWALKDRHGNVAFGDDGEYWLSPASKEACDYVRQASAGLRSLRPGLTISCAVFPLSRATRLSLINQDWESWVSAGLIDCLVPMTYAAGAAEFKVELDQVLKSVKPGVEIMPGVALSKCPPGLLRGQIDFASRSGCCGVTFFACAHFNASVESVLLRLAGELSSPHRKDDDERLAQLDEWRNG